MEFEKAIGQNKIYGWIGIDPGATGAIAIVRSDNVVLIHDYPEDESALVTCLQFIDMSLTGSITAALIEAQQPRPTDGCKQAFSIGGNYKGWLMALAFMRWPFRAIRPQEWKRGLGYPQNDKKLGKEYSRILARRMYPQATDLLARVKDHNRAEALILAHLARTGGRS
jgi:crossover junction endodeoxyribonuclease RuvC